MTSRIQITLEQDFHRLVAALSSEPGPQFDIAEMFDLFDEGPATDIARDKDKMVGQAVWREHLRKTGNSAQRQRG